MREGVRLVDGDLLRTVVRDVRYAAHTTLVELDGVLGHAGALDRWADLDRDLESAVAGFATLRAGWQQVLEPCRLAVVVAGVLRSRGWTGLPHVCGSPGCPVGLSTTRPECA